MRRAPIVSRLIDTAIGSAAPLIERFRTSNLRTDLLALVGPDARVVFDVGANIGQSAALFSVMFPRASIFAFERLPRACQALRSLGISRIEAIEAAVGAGSGKARLHVNSESQTNSLLTPSEVGRELFGDRLEELDGIDVTVISLDDFCDSQKIDVVDVLKIDTQGSELSVLRGAKRMLPTVRVVQVEANFVAQYEGSATFGEVDAYLRENHFTFYNMYQLWRDHVSRRLIFANCVYFKPAT